MNWKRHCSYMQVLWIETIRQANFKERNNSFDTMKMNKNSKIRLYRCSSTIYLIYSILNWQTRKIYSYFWLQKRWSYTFMHRSSSYSLQILTIFCFLDWSISMLSHRFRSDFIIVSTVSWILWSSEKIFLFVVFSSRKGSYSFRFLTLFEFLDSLLWLV